ncbi:Aryl-phospho-beta-D-glucosidase BglC, GH1 family [Verrucomicrobium sp. GAS474]|uniref:glycoside hydrolase family 5 protein n=1 Tax=Verrucomicrobium sp. GAS474 TaxID=1882831 RepID=UPI00087D0820|nr:glycoside hydrolase family 5 protein [Verrucomicrobium sp. GAS474]SDT89072.1 Aryl-phospho-beta-D-glucosidase BglC, GH1 family [Verrucomicrobium sp. GAS474]
MKAILRGTMLLLSVSSILLQGGAGNASAEPILAIDFDAGSSGASPLQPGWQAFAPVSLANQTGPITATYSGLDPALTSGTVVVSIAAGTTTTATGALTSRDRSLMEDPEFPLYYLYRDFVTAGSPITIGISGLTPGGVYQIGYTAYDDSNSRTMTFTNYTSGSAGSSSSLSWTAHTVFDESTDPAVCTRTLSVTADGTGKAVLRITSGDGGASTVLGGLTISKTPATWHLIVNQTNSQDWTSAYLSHWNANAGGGGASPTSINVADTYVNDQGVNQLRAPASTSTFAGGLLVLGGTAQLTLKTGSAATSTIPNFLSTGGTIAQGVASITQHLNVGDYEVDGTTSLSAGSGRGIALAVTTLHGDGDLSVSGGGTFSLSFNDASDYTGTIRLVSGTLSVQSPLATQGPLVISTGAQVALNQPVYVTDLTVAGTALSAGAYSYSSLNGSYAAIFSSGSSSGAIYVGSAAAAPRMGGVNLSCAEWGPLPGVYGTQYTYPTSAEFDYYHGKGLNLIRLPFLWERLQPTLNAALNAAELARMDTVVGYAHARGMKIILDMHNYDRYNGNLVGFTAVPDSAFRDVWRRIADHYKAESAVYGYDIMNEPHDTGGAWPASAQQAVSGIREVDATHYVMVEGDNWAGAYAWETSNANLDILDPAGRLVYEAHCYFDAAASGSYSVSYDAQGAYPTIGVDRVRPFVHWLQFHNFQGYIGEVGVPYNDSRWLTCLSNFYDFVVANGLSTTYWAGGPSWSSTDGLNCEPVGGVDRPQMSVIQNYP